MSYQEPEFLPWDGRRVPITFLAGYLGAGKTTLVNQLLERADRPLAVMVNDVGTVNVDARLVKRRSGQTIELSDGCVCCSLSEGFGFAFDQLRARPDPPDHVIVELSGVAEPDRVLPWSRTAGFRLDGVVTVVDSERFLELIDTTAVGHAMERQIATADVVVLSKVDLIDRSTLDRVRDRIASLAPELPMVSSQMVDVASLLQLGGRRDRAVDVPAATLFDRHVATLQPLPVPVEVAEVRSMLEALGEHVMRAKGIAQSRDGARWLVERVGRRISITPLPASEEQEPTDLVVITVSTEDVSGVRPAER